MVAEIMPESEGFAIKDYQVSGQWPRRPLTMKTFLYQPDDCPNTINRLLPFKLE